MYFLGDIPRLGARRYPNRKALIMGNASLTYSQLNTLANRLTYGLLSLGVSPGDRIAILAEDCLEYAIINYAVAKSGAILVPINFRYKKTELVYAINNSEPCVIFYGPQFINLIDDARVEFGASIRLVSIGNEPLDSGHTINSLMDGRSTSEPSIVVDPNSPAVIMFTSGTTGFPKGALLSHAAYLNLYPGLAVEGDMNPNEVNMVAMPLFHNGGLNGCLQPTLAMGGTALIMGRGFDPEKVLDAVERHGVTMTLWVPTMLAMLVNHPNVTKHNLSTLKKIWYGSSPISPNVLEAAQELFKAKFYQWYGQVETGMLSVLRPEDHANRSHCTGREMFNVEIRIVNEEGQETPMGEAGEIISKRWPTGMIAYHKMEKATGETIRDGWIHTGDVARAEEDGYFTIVGRTKDMIISGAENIYPKEIEDVLTSHSGVQEAVVIGIPDDIWGESVCAVVVLREGHQMSEAGLIEFCAERLSGYKKPKKVVFMNELPKNAAGKVTKNVLREPFWANRREKI